MTNGTWRVALAGFCALGLSGCVVNIAESTPDQAEAVPSPPVSMICNAEKAQSHIGHDATQAIGTAILRDAGARTLRWGPPNGAWTMDYREDRVNVRYDENMKITGITCG